MQSFIDVQLTLSLESVDLAGLLVDEGVLGVWEQDGVIHLYWDEQTWDTIILDRIYEALRQLGVVPDSKRIVVRTIPWEDWNAKWTEFVQPIQIGQRIVVRPSWASVELPSNGIELILDPKQAFGTGHHATTQLLVEWLEEAIQGGERLLDVGTGSGLLAMVALRLGASSAVGVDCDSVAIDCAKEYAQVNYFDEGLEFRICDISSLPANESFDLIVANIDRRTLLANHGAFTASSHSTTRLFVSGILTTDQEDIVAQYTRQGWRCVERRRQEDWMALQFQLE